MPARNDTGHAFGLLRCLVHDDGHVSGVAVDASQVAHLEATHALLAELGLDSTLRLEWLTDTEAMGRYMAGLGCAGCRVRVSCGCDVVQDVLTRQCPHGTYKAIRQAAIRSGFLDKVPAPPGGQATLNAKATALVAEDARLWRHHGRKKR